MTGAVYAFLGFLLGALAVGVAYGYVIFHNDGDLPQTSPRLFVGQRIRVVVPSSSSATFVSDDGTVAVLTAIDNTSAWLEAVGAGTVTVLGIYLAADGESLMTAIGAVVVMPRMPCTDILFGEPERMTW